MSLSVDCAVCGDELHLVDGDLDAQLLQHWTKHPDQKDRPGATSSELDQLASRLVAAAAGVPDPHDGEAFHRYWVLGPGLAKWASSPHPWTALHRHLAKYIHDPAELDATTSKWHNEVFAPTGSDRYRVEHGGTMRGKRIGPG